MSDFAFSQQWEDSLSKPFDEALDALRRSLGLDTNSLFSETPPRDPPDLPLARLIPHPSVVVVLGHRGKGKTVLCCRIQDLKRDIAPPYAIDLPPKARRILPDWYGLADNPFDVPPNAVIYIPESYRMFHARATQTAQGRTVGDLVNLSRHRRHTLIFDVQNPAHLDRNIISEADVILVKEPGPFTQGFDRPQLRPIMNSARAAFAGVGASRKKRAVWVVAPGQDIEGTLMENIKPSFWSEALSRTFGDSVRPPTYSGRKSVTENQPPDHRSTAPPRRGRKSETEKRRKKAKQLKDGGYSYTEIGNIFGVSKSQAYRLVNSD
ncbi:MAG: hypothetical protein V3U90_03385, partial [Dehalococcoidia bacterium]